MARKRIYITEPRLVWRSPEGRAEVWQNGPGDYTVFVDLEPIAFCRTQGEAEVKAGVALYELMEVA